MTLPGEGGNKQDLSELISKALRRIGEDIDPLLFRAAERFAQLRLDYDGLRDRYSNVVAGLSKAYLVDNFPPEITKELEHADRHCKRMEQMIRDAATDKSIADDTDYLANLAFYKGQDFKEGHEILNSVEDKFLKPKLEGVRKLSKTLSWPLERMCALLLYSAFYRPPPNKE